MGSRAQGLRCPEARGSSPDQGWNPCLLHWQADSLPPSLQGSPLFFTCLSLSQQTCCSKCDTVYRQAPVLSRGPASSPGLASTPLSAGMSLTRCDLSPTSQLHLRNICQREMLDSFGSPCPITWLPWIWTRLELTSICLWKRTLLFWYFEIALKSHPSNPILPPTQLSLWISRLPSFPCLWLSRNK